MATKKTTAADFVTEQADNFMSIANMCKGWGFKPMVAVVDGANDPNAGTSVLMLYASEVHPDATGKVRSIPITPHFFHWAVASELVRRGVIKETTTTTRGGITVHWLEVVFPDK